MLDQVDINTDYYADRYASGNRFDTHANFDLLSKLDFPILEASLAENLQ